MKIVIKSNKYLGNLIANAVENFKIYNRSYLINNYNASK